MADHATYLDSVITTANRVVASWLNAVNDFVYRGSNPLYVVTTGSANAYTLTIPPTSLKTALAAGDRFYGKANFTNTGAVTLTVVGASSFTAAAVQQNGAALGGGEIRSGAPFCVQWDGTAYELIGPFGGGAIPGGIIGTTAGGDATAGRVGEYISSTLASGSAVSLVSSTAKNVTSASYTAGDWDITGIIYFKPAATTSITDLQAGVSAVTNTSGTGVYADIASHLGIPSAGYVSNTYSVGYVLPTYRVNLTSTTTVYLIAYGTFSVDTLSAFGTIRGRRVR